MFLDRIVAPCCSITDLALSTETEHQHKAANFLCHHFHKITGISCLFAITNSYASLKYVFSLFLRVFVMFFFNQNLTFAILAAQSRKQLEFELDIVCQNKPKCFFEIKKLFILLKLHVSNLFI